LISGASLNVILTILGRLMTIRGIIRIVVLQVAIETGPIHYGGRARAIVVALMVCVTWGRLA
jgi:hypothetical protein